jgi:TonB-linked SusC/RagA family outer membrane protein
LFASIGYWNQEGVAGGDKSQFTRYNARINASHKLKDWITIGENFSYSNATRQNFAEDSEYGGVVGSALSLDPLTPVRYDNDNLPQHMGANGGYIDVGRPLNKDANGNYMGTSRWVTGEFGNPLTTYDIQKQNTETNKIFGNVFVEIKPIENLTFTSRYGIDAAFQRRHYWNPTYFYSIERQNTVANGGDAWDEWFTTQWENFATYDKTFGDHHITATLGTSLIQFEHNWLTTQYSGLFRQTDTWSYANGATRDADVIGGNKDANNLLSFFARASYDFKDRYLFTATVRRDGSSLFADGKQWGVFPSVSLGWVASNEDFYAPVADFMSFFKLRGYWGQNGSNANVNPGEWRNYITTLENGRAIRYADALGTYLSGAAPAFAENPNLTWETSEQIGFGADMRFLSDKLTLSFDWFKKTTEDLITPGNAPGPAGISMARVNAGTVENKGIEIELGYSGSTSSDGLHYTLSANFSAIKNEVTALNEGTASEPAGANVGTHWNNATRFKVGEPIWYFQGYKTDGIFQSTAEITAYLTETGITGYNPVPGDPRVIDVNGDKSIGTSDYVNIGSPHPDFYYGVRAALDFKGFDFMVFLQGQGGNEVLMGFFRTDRGTANKPAFFYEDRWTAEKPTNDWFRASTGGQAYSSDLMIDKGDFMRIRQLQLGYSLPKSVTENLRIKGFRIYGSLDNYFTFTKYKGMDPEAGSNNNNSLYIDRGVYPVPRKALLGCTLTF